MKTAKRLALLAALVVIVVAALLYRPDIPLDELRADYSDAASRFVEIEGMEVHYKDEGSGPPLLLIHGTAASLHTWDGWVAALSSNFRTVRLDFPGFALTGPDPSGDYSIERRVELAIAFLDSLGIDRCAVVGNSLGGYIAWQLAARHPERVDSLILIDAAGYQSANRESTVFDLARQPILGHLIARMTPRSLVEKGLVQSYGDPEKVTPELVDLYYRLLRRQGNRQALMASLNSERPDETDRIATIESPALIMWGREDRLIPVEHADRFHHDLPDSRLVIYDGVGHVPMEEIPDQSAADTLEFLLGLAKGSDASPVEVESADSPETPADVDS